MARVLFNQGALLKSAIPHIGAATVELRIRRGYCDLWSEEATTGLPCETRWQGGTAVVELEKLLAALHSIPDQPITLDLHHGPGARLFATLDKLPDAPFDPANPHGWRPVDFQI